MKRSTTLLLFSSFIFLFLPIAHADMNWQALEATSDQRFEPGPYTPAFGVYPTASDFPDLPQNASPLDSTQKAMEILTESRLPNISCPLVDTTTDADLMSAVENLYGTSGAISACGGKDDPINPADVQNRLSNLTYAMQRIYKVFTNVPPPANPNTPNNPFPAPTPIPGPSPLPNNPPPFTINKDEPPLFGGTKPLFPMPGTGPYVNPNPTSTGNQSIWFPWSPSNPSSTDGAQFYGDLQLAFSNIQILSDTLSKAIGNSKCKDQADSFTSVLSSLADITSTIAPYALAAISANPAWGALLKPVLGVTTLATGATFLKNMGTTLNKNNPKHRKAILTNLCEYARVSQRRRLIYFAQEPSPNNVQKFIREKANSEINFLAGRQTPLIAAVLKRRDEIQGQLLQVRGDIANSLNTLHSVFNQLSSSPSDTTTCEVGKNIIGSVTKENELVSTLMSAYSHQLQYQVEPTISETAQINTEHNLRATFHGTDTAMCARETEAYLIALYKIARTGLVTSGQLQGHFRKWLDQNDAVLDYLKDEDSFQIEQRTRENLKNIVSRYKDVKGVINRQEINTMMIDIREALFADRPRFVTYLTGTIPAPAQLWLDFSQELLRQNKAGFIDEYDALVATTLNYTKTGGNRAFEAIPQDGSSVAIEWKRTGKVYLWGHDKELDALLKQASIDDASAEKLETLTTANLLSTPTDPEDFGQKPRTKLESTCGQVQSALTQMRGVLDSLRAQGLFCETLFDFNLVDTSISKKLRETCAGKIDGRNVLALPYVMDQVKKFKAAGLWDHWQRTEEKFNTLNCERPKPPPPAPAPAPVTPTPSTNGPSPIPFNPTPGTPPPGGFTPPIFMPVTP